MYIIYKIIDISDANAYYYIHIYVNAMYIYIKIKCSMALTGSRAQTTTTVIDSRWQIDVGEERGDHSLIIHYYSTLNFMFSNLQRIFHN